MRHPLSERYHAILRELGDLHDQKQRDYGREGDPFANVRSTQEWGQPAWVGAMIRATDKLKRLQTYATKGTLANEGVEDSFKDLAVYAVIGLVLWEQEQGLPPEFVAGVLEGKREAEAGLGKPYEWGVLPQVTDPRTVGIKMPTKWTDVEAEAPRSTVVDPPQSGAYDYNGGIAWWSGPCGCGTSCGLCTAILSGQAKRVP